MSRKQRIILIIIVLLILPIIFFFHKLFELKDLMTGFNSNGFEIKINDNKINYYIHDEYTFEIIPTFLESSSTIRTTWVYDDKEDKINTTNVSDKYELSIQEFECLSINNDVTIDCATSEDYNKKHIKSNFKSLTIWYENEIIYDNSFTSNVSDFINKEGRYHFNVKIDSDNSEIEIIFNIKVTGDEKVL